MKRGFALLETIIVVTFLSVSLLLLYSTFVNMVSNSKKNILYDDASNIYRVYYLKEYLVLYGLESLDTNSIKEITCSDLNIPNCNYLLNILAIHKLYLVKYDSKNIDIDNSSLNNYLSSLSNKEGYKYRLIAEFNNEPNYSYASLGVGYNYE